MILPESPDLHTEKLGAVFNKTTATYKYFWFLSLLELVVKEGRTQFAIWDVIAHMVSLAWYPIHYFHLSFGKSDSMEDRIRLIQEETQLTIDQEKSDIIACLLGESDKRKRNRWLDVFTHNVPYRFLMPWLQTTDDAETARLSQTFTNDCLYSIAKIDGDLMITMNPHWKAYLQKNYTILHDFAYWNLTLFLQTRNPNVPNIAAKLIKPAKRESLSNQRKFWDTVIREQGGIHCLYTDKLLLPGDYDLDHFIPWSFVTHDQIWNLMPADSSINSSKSDHLPDLDRYLGKLALQQQKAAEIIYRKAPRNKTLEDYLNITDSLDEFIHMQEDNLMDVFSRTFRPLVQIASNMNFETWKF